MVGYRVPAANIADDLTFLLGRVVLDRAGITVEFDVDLTWTPDSTLLPADAGAVRSPAEQADRRSLFTALQQQLGLWLQSERARIPTIVVERAEKPAAN